MFKAGSRMPNQVMLEGGGASLDQHELRNGKDESNDASSNARMVAPEHARFCKNDNKFRFTKSEANNEKTRPRQDNPSKITVEPSHT